MKGPINEANAPYRKKFTPRVSVLFSTMMAMELHFYPSFNTLAFDIYQCKRLSSFLNDSWYVARNQIPSSNMILPLPQLRSDSVADVLKLWRYWLWKYIQSFIHLLLIVPLWETMSSNLRARWKITNYLKKNKIKSFFTYSPPILDHV